MDANNPEKKRKRILTPSAARAALATIAAASLLCVSGCSGKKADAKANAPEVSVMTPLQKAVQPYEDFPGRAMPIETVDIKARVTGHLSEVQFREGSEVKAGDPLYLIDPREYQAEFDSASANLVQMQARMAQALADTQRAKRLGSETAISKQELEKQYTAYHEAEAGLRVAQAAVDKTKLNVEYTQVRSPIDGKIGNTRVTKGNLVEDGDTLTSVVQQNPIYVYFEAPERVILSWQEATRNIPKATAATTTKVLVGLPNEPGYPRETKLDFTDNAINSGTGTLRMRVILPNEDRRIQPGMFTRVRMLLNEPVSTLLVPDRAVVRDQGQQFVYVVGADDKVDYRRVTTGQIYDGMRAVVSGIQPGERVVVEGLQHIEGGSLVRPVEVVPEEKTPAKGDKGDDSAKS